MTINRLDPMKTIYSFFLLFLFTLSFSQSKSGLELKKELSKQQDPKKKVALLYDLGDEYKEKDSAFFYYEKAKKLAEEINYLQGVAKYSSHAIEFLNYEGEFRKGLELTLWAHGLYEEINDPKNLAISFLNIGNQLHYLSDLRGATENYLKAKKIVDSLKNEGLQRVLATNLSSIFIEQKDYPKGISYGLFALKLGEKSGEWQNQVSSLYNLSVAYQDQGRDDLALKYTERLEKIGIQEKDTLSLIDAFLAKGLIFGKTSTQKGLSFYDRAIDLSKKALYPEYEMNGLAGRARLYLKEGNFLLAQRDIKEGKILANKMEMDYELTEFLELSSLLHEKMGNFQLALAERKNLEALEKKLESEKYKNDILNLESRYQFQQKEAELISQKKALKNKSLLNYIFIVLMVLLGIILYQALKNHRNKQKLHTQRIQELETERQLLSTQNLLLGQEQERSRLAKELHDGLGGLLSGVKINLNQMKNNSTINDQDHEVFERSVHMIDTSIKELRRVAHNLMPESIIQLGLEEAIKEFLLSLEHDEMSIIYLPYGIKKGTGREMDISIYRIVQELLNNIIKHAKATQVLVQVRKDSGVLSIDVEDNGVGFDPNNKTSNSGMGLKSIQSRVDLWNGTLEIDSKEGEGTSVSIELEIKEE